MRCAALAPAHAAGDLLDRRGEGVEAVHARAALAGALAGEPAGDAGRFGDGTGFLGEQQHDACSERGAVGGQVFV